MNTTMSGGEPVQQDPETLSADELAEIAGLHASKEETPSEEAQNN